MGASSLGNGIGKLNKLIEMELWIGYFKHILFIFFYNLTK
jgi:hypothetical protein